MPLDIEAMKRNFAKRTGAGKKKEGVLKLEEGLNTVRIVPSAQNPDTLFIEGYFHYKGGKTLLSPKTFGEPDPFEEFSNELISDYNSTGERMPKEEYISAKKLCPELRTFVPVVVVGKESEGVKLWGFSNTSRAKLMSLFEDPDYGDFTDVEKGHNVKLTFTPADKSPTRFAQTQIDLSPKQSKLTDDKALLQKLLTIQPKLEDIFTLASYEELEKMLVEHCKPTETEAPSPKEEANDGWASPAEPVSVSEKISTETKSKPSVINEEFDKMFENI